MEHKLATKYYDDDTHNKVGTGKRWETNNHTRTINISSDH